MRVKYILIIGLILIISGCNKSNTMYERNKKFVQEKILNESNGVIELVDFKITNIISEKHDEVEFEGVVEFKEDTYKEYIQFGNKNEQNPFISFRVFKKASGSTLSIYDSHYMKNERANIFGRSTYEFNNELQMYEYGIKTGGYPKYK